MTVFQLFRLLTISIALLFSAVFSYAQTAENPMDEIVKSATDSGMQVIVINPNTDSQEDELSLEEQLQQSFMMNAQERAVAFRTTLRNRIATAPQAMDEVFFILNAQSPSGHFSAYFGILFITLALLIAAELLVYFGVVKWFIAPWFFRLQSENPMGYTEKLPILLLRTALALLGLLLVVLVSYVLGFVIYGEAEDGTVRLTVAYIYLTYVTSRGIVFLWRMILTPFQPQYRIPYFSDADAKRMFFWLLTVASISVVVVNFMSWLQELGLDYNIHALMTSFFTLLVVFLNVAMVLMNHSALSKAI